MKAPTLLFVALLLLTWHVVIGDSLADLRDRAQVYAEDVE